MSSRTFTDALTEVSTIAHAKLPETLHSRLEMATALVTNGAVFPEDDGVHAFVRRRKTPGKWHAVNASCPCEDAHYQAPSGLCAHRLVMALYRRATQRMQEPVETPGAVLEAPESPAVLPEAPPVALPEAPVSANVHIQIEGRQVQLTVRGTCEADVLARLTAILKQHPAPQPPAQQSGPTSSGKGWCQPHGVQMRWNEGKNGRKGWYSHRLADGSWCKDGRG